MYKVNLQMTSIIVYLFLFLLIVILKPHVDGRMRCPRMCTGHGMCLEDRNRTRLTNPCECFDGYTGIDCSQRTCAKDYSWAGKPYDVDQAHLLAECSNNGICNRKNGKCACFPGYAGPACRESTCGRSKCSGHGACLTMNEAYRQASYAQPTFTNYSRWEGTHVTMCACEIGYSGPDCSYRLCPKGDDPFTPSNARRGIQLTTYITENYYDDYFRFTFMDNSFLFQPYHWTSESCQAALDSLPNFGLTNCTVIRVNEEVNNIYIYFLSWPVLPYENNIFTHNGNPSLQSFGCDTFLAGTSTEGVDCLIQDIPLGDDDVLPEYAVCSNRGVCDVGTGLCNCFLGFTNSNCDTLFDGNDIDIQYASNRSVLQLVNDNTGFNAAFVKLDNNPEDTEECRYISYGRSPAATPKNIFQVDCTGDIIMSYGGLHLGKNATGYSGQTIVGGLNIDKGGLTVTTDGFNISEYLQVEGSVSIVDGGLKVSRGFVSIGQDMQLQQLTVTSALTVTGGATVSAGGFKVLLGGLMVTGGATIAAGGAYIAQKGVTIQSTGIFINSGGLFVQGAGSRGLSSSGGITLYSGGFVLAGSTAGLGVSSAGLLVTGGMSVRSGGVVIDEDGLLIGGAGGFVTGGLTIADGGFLLSSGALSVRSGGIQVLSDAMAVTGGLSVGTGGWQVTGGLSVIGDMRVFSSATVSSGGVVSGLASSISLFGVSTDVLTAQTNGVKVSSSFGGEIRSDGAHVSDGVAVQSMGVKVTGGLTVNSALLVTTGGVSLSSDGLKVLQDGMVIQDQGLRVTGGLTVVGGVKLLSTSSGLSVKIGGSSIVDGMTIDGAGMRITSNGATIGAGGLHVDSGMSVAAGGGLVTGGLSVQTQGLYVTKSGVTVAAGGIYVTGGLSIKQDGVRIAGGITVDNGGVMVAKDSLVITAGGLVVSDNGLSVVAKGLRAVTGNIRVYDSGMSIKNSLQIGNLQGLYVTQDGLTVSSNGMVVSDGMTVAAMGVSVLANGITVTSGGFVQDALHVNRDGLLVSLAGMTMLGSDGVTVLQGGVRVVAGGLRLAHASGDGLQVIGTMNIAGGGLTVYSDGANVVDTGMTVTGGGLRVTAGGATIVQGGLSVTQGGVTVAAGGLSVENKFIVQAQGMRSTGGLTVYDTGLSVAQNGLTVTQGGVQIVDGGMEVQANGMVISSGSVVVQDIGLRVTGGLTVANSMQIANGGLSIAGGGLYLSGGFDLKVQDIGVTAAENVTVYNYAYLNGGYSVTSDKRLKADVRRVTQALHKLSQLQAFWYSIVNTTESDSSRHLGLMAQDLQRVIPEAVSEFQHHRDGRMYLTVQYDALLGVLIEAVNELQQLAQLEKELLDLLEAQNVGSLHSLYEEDNDHHLSCEKENEVAEIEIRLLQKEMKRLQHEKDVLTNIFQTLTQFDEKRQLRV